MEEKEIVNEFKIDFFNKFIKIIIYILVISIIVLASTNLSIRLDVKDHIKNGDLLLCEINANEIWVSTRITLNNSFYDKIIFTCDIKIRKNMKVRTFKEIVYKIGFNIFLKKYICLKKILK